MKIPCDLILDLLPLYHNNLCSEVSEAIIAEHLETCEKCIKILDKMEAAADIPPYEEDPTFEKLLNAACK
jgi:predicted anti-sigma-YlaC factor YlaD